MIGVMGLNTRIAEKILSIEREDVGHPIGLHDRHESRIVDLDAAHVIGNHQLAPEQIDLLAVGQESHGAFDIFDPLVGFCNCEAVAVPVKRPCAYIPKLGNILQRETKFRSPLNLSIAVPMNSC